MIFTICVVLQMLLYYNYHTVIRKLEQQYYPQWSIFTHLRLTITINLCYGARMKTHIHKARIIDMKRYIIMFRIWFLQKINDASRQPSIVENSEKSIVSYSPICKKRPLLLWNSGSISQICELVVTFVHYESYASWVCQHS